MDIHEETISLPFEIDFLTLTGDETIPSGQLFPIYYESFDSGDATITFFYDLDRNPRNGRNIIGSASNAFNEAKTISSDYIVFLPLLEKGVPPLPKEVDILSGDIYHWNTTNVPLGAYYIAADISDGFNTTTWYSEVPVYIQASQ